jgi:putative phosphoribosyl transferase
MFADRTEAGRRLGTELQSLNQSGCEGAEIVVLALPRGGVPVGYEVAKALGAELDVFVVRKLGAPMQPELAMGAIASGGVRVMNEEIVRALRITEEQIDDTVARETQELQRRELAYRGDRPRLDVEGRCVLLVDDGVATGYTMRAAVQSLRQRRPKRVIVAVPVAAQSTCTELSRYADGVVCLMTPFDFAAVGQWYSRFEQTTDEEVRVLLQQAAHGTQPIA